MLSCPNISVEDAAQQYADLCIVPVRLHPLSKKPVDTGWVSISAADSLSVLRGHEGNIGLALGQPSGGLVDVDIDCEEARRVASALLPTTEAVHGRPSSPASHHWYSVDDDCGRTTQFKDPSGTVLVELRSTGGQTMVPPSVHPSGEALEWVSASALPARTTWGGLDEAVRALAAVALVAQAWPSVGSRHECALALAGTLLLAGMDQKEVQSFVDNVCIAASDDEREKRVDDVSSTAARISRGEHVSGIAKLQGFIGADAVSLLAVWLDLDVDWANTPAWQEPIPLSENAELPTFPVSELPDWLSRLVQDSSTSLQTPLALIASLALAACSVAVARKAVVAVTEDHHEPLNIWLLVALQSGTRKSAARELVTRPIRDHEEDLVREWNTQVGALNLEAEVRRAELKNAIDAAKAASDRNAREKALDKAIKLQRQIDSLGIPPQPRLLSDDFTPEKLVGLLADHGGRVAAIEAEGGLLDVVGGLYSRGVPKLDKLLKAHAGDDVRVDRVGRTGEYVRSPALTLGLAVQPGLIKELAQKGEFRHRGFWARFLFALPLSLLGMRQVAPPAIPVEVLEEYEQRLKALLSLPVDENAARPRSRRAITLSDEARARFQDLSRNIEGRLGAGGDLENLTDWAGKLPGAAVRLAGVLHCASLAGSAERPWEVPLEGSTMANACGLAEYFIAHAKAAFDAMGVNKSVHDAQRVLRWLEQEERERFSVRDAFNGMRSRFKRVANLRPALRLLEEHGYLARELRPRRKGRGRPPSDVYLVNPLWRA